MNKTQKRDLREFVREMKDCGDAVAKIVGAHSIEIEYGSSLRDGWRIYLQTAAFEEAFGDQVTTLTHRDSDSYPYERSILIEGVKFYCILGVDDLTKEENRERIDRELNELLKLKAEIGEEDE